jgi:hypothetical protein
MRRQAAFLLLLAVILAGRLGWAESFEERVAALRAGFSEIGRREIARSGVPREQWRNTPDPYQALLPVLHAPPEILQEAIDRGIREGDVEERIGAMEVYQIAISPPKIRLQKRPEYQVLLMDLLKHDDQECVTYTGVVITTLREYRSRETVLAFLDAAPRMINPVMREGLLRSSAVLLHLDVPIYTDTTLLEKERILSNLEAWLNRNRDRIRFNKDGQPYLAGGEASESSRLELTPEDRDRIRKDPTCVLKLVQAMIGGQGAVSELAAQCGEALLGTEGARLFHEARKGSQESGPPSLDFQSAMATVRGKYPTMDAVQLAIAYVAAYETDPEAISLARDTLEDFGAPEMSRVLKGEPREVRKKAKELSEGLLNDSEEK